VNATLLTIPLLPRLKCTPIHHH